MLPSLGINEIVVLAVLALVVVGPKDLPLLLRKLGRWTAKLRGMAQEFRTGFDELARQAELDELKREVEALRRTTSVTELTREITKDLPTLEDYAGLPKSQPPGPATASTRTEDAAPREASAPAADPSSPQTSPHDEKLAVEPAQSDVDERAPIARSAP